MSIRWNPREHVRLAGHLLKWLLIATPVAAIVGSAVALFLWLLDRATQTRWDHPALLFGLPIAGAAIGLLYHHFGGNSDAGNNLIIEQIHEPGGGLTPQGVPKRMAPLVLIGTVVTHLFGGSAGREGTAVQMGGSIANAVARPLRLDRKDTSTLMMCGVAAGFGAVFGTPIAGAIFAMEVLSLGKIHYHAAVPCLIAAIVGERATAAWGIRHTTYSIQSAVQSASIGPAHLDLGLAGKVALAAVAFGIASVLFAQLTHGLTRAFKRFIPHPALRPAVGGAIVVALVYLLGTRDYLGLGVAPDPHHAADAVSGGVSIVTSFHAGGATPWSWWWKILFTAVTLGAGFKGGEVTPLFFVGATLGNTLGKLLNAPVDLFAALGFVAVFAGATNTPLACTIMAVELFAPASPDLLASGFLIYATIACFVAYLSSGHTGIYHAQRRPTEMIDR